MKSHYSRIRTAVKVVLEKGKIRGKSWVGLCIGFGALIWFVVRVIPRPSRAGYPCQRAAFPLASGFVLWICGIGTCAAALGQSKLLGRLKGGRRVASVSWMMALACLGSVVLTCSDVEVIITGTAAAERNGTINEKEAVVAIVQADSPGQNLSLNEIRQLVTSAVSMAGGLGFIENGDSVLLKPNLITTTTSNFMPLPIKANGVTTDWRIVRVVAELVRNRNPDGNVYIMEGSSVDTEDAFAQLGYVEANLSDVVDDIIPLEGRRANGNSCSSPDNSNLVEVVVNGRIYVVDRRYRDADVVISLPVLKTHNLAVVTGAVKNIGIGMSPVAAYPNENNWGCTRSFTTIDHTDIHTISPFITAIYSINPARFAVMDGLRGLANGPEPSWNNGEYNEDVKDMRLIIASADPVALDTVEALLAQCDYQQIDYLELLNSSGLGQNHPEKIKVVGEPISNVRQPLSGHSACSAP